MLTKTIAVVFSFLFTVLVLSFFALLLAEFTALSFMYRAGLVVLFSFFLAGLIVGPFAEKR